MAKKQNKTQPEIIREKVVNTTLELAAEQGWTQTSLAAIATRADIPLHELHDHFEDRFDILAAYGRMIDKRVMAEIGAPDPGLTAREALFDILMERFDVLNEQREGVRAILKSFCLDPKQAVISLPHLGRSMSWMLEAAGIDTAGYRGALKVAGLSGLYLKTLKVWMSDDSPDMGKTMAALDKHLGRAEKWADSFGL